MNSMKKCTTIVIVGTLNVINGDSLNFNNEQDRERIMFNETETWTVKAHRKNQLHIIGSQCTFVKLSQTNSIRQAQPAGVSPPQFP